MRKAHTTLWSFEVQLHCLELDSVMLYVLVKDQGKFCFSFLPIKAVIKKPDNAPSETLSGALTTASGSPPEVKVEMREANTTLTQEGLTLH